MSLIETSNLNLARKWRPQTFATIIGQDIPVRMLKNSLYLKKFFPVYLFAGQRGCGKTTTARVFAAAVNCLNVAAFQADPTQPIPCMTCTSCLAMSNGDHPDFIEIDAASHTGVDNVRSIIEASNYLPLIGQKKIYLIDEAHMLSKAAFNAFLKILEEPPLSVMFMLATTDTPKIPPTVLSRCFQLTFPPIETTALKAHLHALCLAESVTIDDGALDIILQETEGSARDAINLLERVRFAGTEINAATVLHILGKISGHDMVTILDGVVHQKPEQIINHLQAINFYTRSAHALWDMLVLCARSMLWLKHGVKQLPLSLRGIQPELEKLATACSASRLHAMLTLLWTQEFLFNQTNKKHLLVETVLLQLADQVNITDIDELLRAPSTNNTQQTPVSQLAARATQPAQPIPVNQFSQFNPNLAQTRANQLPERTVQSQQVPVNQFSTNAAVSQLSQVQTAQNTPSTAPTPQAPINTDNWQAFLKLLPQLNDPMVTSVFMQATFLGVTPQHKVSLALSAGGMFMREYISSGIGIWLPLLQQAFGPAITGIDWQAGPTQSPPSRTVTFTPTPAPQQPTTQLAAQTQPKEQAQSRPAGANQPWSGHQSKPAPVKEDFITIKDPENWPLASLLLRHFSGRIKRVGNLA